MSQLFDTDIDADDGLIDLTEDIQDSSSHAFNTTQASVDSSINAPSSGGSSSYLHPYSHQHLSHASSLNAGSLTVHAPSPALMRQQNLLRGYEQKQSSVSIQPQPRQQRTSPQQHQYTYGGNKPRLHLTQITHTPTTPPLSIVTHPSPAAASSSTPVSQQQQQQAKREVQPTNLAPIFRAQTAHQQQQQQQQVPPPSSFISTTASSSQISSTPATVPFAVGVRKRKQETAPHSSSTTTAAAASSSHDVFTSSQQFDPSSWQSYPSQSSMPSLEGGAVSQRNPTAAAASSVSYHSATPAAPAAASSSSSYQLPQSQQQSKYVANADELLMARRRDLDEQLAAIEAEERALATKRRGIMNEIRQVEAELNKPMQLPYAKLTPAAAQPIGGVSALLSGSDYWSGKFAWDEAALNILQNVFRINTYRISQREVINATMEKKDVFCIMPTGAGKSLLYQLPAMLNEGVTLVISPLLSLMEDQVMNLRSVGIESYMLCATTSKEDVKRIHAEMTDKHSAMRLLYVTPEKIAKSKAFLGKLEKMYEIGKFVRIVIDEVHCCSNWGHDFRPDYSKLNILKIQFPSVPILAVTATATDKVVQDCQQILSIRGCQFFKCSFNRPNLHFSVRIKPSAMKAVAQDMFDYIQSIGHVMSTGIIYCYSKKETVELSSALTALGLSCDFYHSDVNPDQRARLHHQWVQGKVKLIVATNAFGLGINKPNVRYVLHHTFPAGVSTYYQEAGRAGRDGLKAYCCLWYSARDLARQSIRVYAKQNMASHLYPMAAYCHTVDQCRRVLMARHFGESMTAAQCQNMCDVCDTLHAASLKDESASLSSAVVPHSAPTVVSRDLTEAAIQICEFVVSGVHGTTKGKRKRAAPTGLTQKQLIDECRKRNSSIVLPKELTRDDCERLVIELLLQGILRETFKNTAYTTVAYIQHDARLLASLRRGDLVIRLNFIEGGEEKKKKPATKKRASKPSSSAAAAAATSSDEVDELIDEEHEDEPEIELDDDDEDRPIERKYTEEKVDQYDDDEEEVIIPPSQSSEDQPIKQPLKRLKKGPSAPASSNAKPSKASSSSSSATRASAPRAAAASSRRASASALVDDGDDDDFMEDADEEAYQVMLMDSAQQAW